MIRLSILSSTTSLIACTGRCCPRRWMRSMASAIRREQRNRVVRGIYLRNSTAGFHQLSIRYTREASVRFSATPPAFKLTRKTVTWTLFTAVNVSHTISAVTARINVLKYLMVASRACGLIVPSRRHTVKPAFCSLNAMRSRKLTNWLKTMLLVVASCARRLLSSSTSASILVDERHLSRSRRPRMPWRALTVSSNSKAGASRSMVRAT